MDHVAILDKKRKFLEKIVAGDKSIESRWYQTRRTPWHNVNPEDNIYFKDMGQPISVYAKVDKVVFIDNLTEKKGLDIIKKYGKQICITKDDYSTFGENKNYCILVFLKDAKYIKPFDIDKTGYGNACAWLTMNNIKKIKK